MSGKSGGEADKPALLISVATAILQGDPGRLITLTIQLRAATWRMRDV